MKEISLRVRQQLEMIMKEVSIFHGWENFQEDETSDFA